LAGEKAVGGQRAALLDGGAVGGVLDAADFVAAVIGEQAGGAEVVAVDIRMRSASLPLVAMMQE
jgi:hypothetical protein